MKFASGSDSSFHKWFLCSMQCCLIAFYSQYNFFQNWSRSSQTLPLLYLLGLCNILNLCCHFNSLYSIFPRSRLHLKKPLSLLIHKKQLLIHENFIMRLKQFNHIFQDLLQILVLLLFPPCLQLLIFWNPQSCSWRVAINIQSLVNIDVLTSSHKLWMSLVASRIVNPIWNEVKVTQCLTLCDPRLYNPWNSPGQNTGVDSRSLLQGIFPTQGLNPGILHCRWILYHLSHQGRPELPGKPCLEDFNLLCPDTSGEPLYIAAITL